MRASRAVAPPLPRVAPPYREESAPLGEGRARSAPAWGVGGRRWPPDREAGRNRSGTAPALRAEGWRGGSTRPSDQARASPNPACDAGVGARAAVSPAAELQGGFPREPDPPHTRVGPRVAGCCEAVPDCVGDGTRVRTHERTGGRAVFLAVPLSSGAGTQPPRPPAEEGGAGVRSTRAGGGGEVVNIYFCVQGGWRGGTSAPEKGFLCSMTEFCR